MSDPLKHASPAALNEIAAALDQALASPSGVIISCASESEAAALRHRFNAYRRQGRKIARSGIYPMDSLLYGASPYDVLSLSIRGPDIIIKRRAPITIKEIAPETGPT